MSNLHEPVRPEYSEETFTSTSQIRLKRSKQGFGFNLVGGKDSPHLPGVSDPFVAYVSPELPAWQAGLRIGDRISQINGQNVEDMCHDDIVNLLRSDKPEIEIEVEPNGEQRLRFESQQERTERLPDATLSMERTVAYVATHPEMKEFVIEKNIDQRKAIGTSHILLFSFGIVIGVAVSFSFLRKGAIY